jgi:hypothetical protein
MIHAATFEASSRHARVAVERSAIELIVAGDRRPVCAPNRVLLDSGSLWSGYRLELIRAPTTGLLEQVSTPQHRIVFVVSGTCTVRYRAYLHEGRHRLSPGTFSFIGRGYVFERLAWKGRGFEAIMIDIANFGVDANPVDAFGRTDALFDNGSGSADDQANFHCEERKKDDLIDTLTIGKQFETSTKANTDSGPD